MEVESPLTAEQVRMYDNAVQVGVWGVRALVAAPDTVGVILGEVPCTGPGPGWHGSMQTDGLWPNAKEALAPMHMLWLAKCPCRLRVTPRDPGLPYVRVCCADSSQPTEPTLSLALPLSPPPLFPPPSPQVWCRVRSQLENALAASGGGRDAWKVYWATLQRFFKLLCVSIKVGGARRWRGRICAVRCASA